MSLSYFSTYDDDNAYPIPYDELNQKEQNGPNINLKYFKKKYNTEEEKQFLFEKIKQKKKTELCKNYELYHDCFYKNECSFAHGIDELRQSEALPKYKTKVCKMFNEKAVCNFGMRCNYRHVICDVMIYSYSYLIKELSEAMKEDMEKKENVNEKILKIYKNVIYKRKVDM